ncbi:MAG TPA: YdcH family protein [Sphingobium sp.]|nr:YdcH family protein [Sphingobium sp.]
MTSQISRLLNRHRDIDDALRREQRQRWPDAMRLQRLKKLKLAVKDRLHALTRTPRSATT